MTEMDHLPKTVTPPK